MLCFPDNLQSHIANHTKFTLMGYIKKTIVMLMIQRDAYDESYFIKTTVQCINMNLYHHFQQVTHSADYIQKCEDGYDTTK